VRIKKKSIKSKAVNSTRVSKSMQIKAGVMQAVQARTSGKAIKGLRRERIEVVARENVEASEGEIREADAD